MHHMRFRRLGAVIATLIGVVVLGACSGESYVPSTKPAVLPVGQPGRDRPPVTLGDKNFTEQFILGQLYAQALRDKGYTVHLKSDIGPSEVIDQELIRGQIDAYPEYIGVIVSELQDIDLAAPGGASAPARTPPVSSEQAYEQAAAFEGARGFALLHPTPFQDADRVATTAAFARAHDLRKMGDLAKLSSFTYGAPPENRNRYQGLRGMQQAYGLNNARFVAIGVGRRYQALNSGKVDTIAAFTTDAQLLRGDYVLLGDPKNIFGYQHVAPVVNQQVLSREGPAFAETLNSVSAKLTTLAIRRMNTAVESEHQSPAAVARRFLAANVLR